MIARPSSVQPRDRATTSGERDVQAAFPVCYTLQQELEGKRGLSDSWIAVEKVHAIAGQTAT